MKFDCFMNQLQDFFFCFSRRDTARQVTHVCTETAVACFDNYCESHFGVSRGTPSGLRTSSYLVQKKPEEGSASYFLGRTESFIALPTRNFNVVFAGI